MSLQPIQSAFALAVAHLIFKALELGYQVTFGDAYRDSRCEYGAPNSKHRIRLAVDLNLFRNNVWLSDTEDHRLLGEYWESIGGIWGGRFDDGNHYEWPDEV